MKTINNKIEENYVTFEIAKLLKEKGFETECYYFFNKGSNWGVQCDNILRQDIVIERPTTALAIKWIKENFNIHIVAYPGVNAEGIIYFGQFLEVKSNRVINQFLQDEKLKELNKLGLAVNKIFARSQDAENETILHVLKFKNNVYN